MKGRMVVLKGVGVPFEIAEWDVPDPDPDGIIAKITQAGICGSDLHIWRGEYSQGPIDNGRTLGHEGVGVVYKLGKNVTTDAAGKPLREGDRIVWSAFHTCGRCYQCMNGRENLCRSFQAPGKPVGEFPYFTGTYADYYYIRANQAVFRAPEELPDSVLGYVNCAMGTVTEGLIQAGCKEGNYVVIQGAGGLGLNAVAMARDMGAHRVIVLDRLDTRLELARQFGASATINVETEAPTREERLRKVQELTDDRGADVVMELVGKSDLLLEGVDFLTPGGTFVEIGAIMPGHPVPFETRSILGGKRVIGSRMYAPRLLPVMLEALVKKQGTVPFDKIVSHTFPLERIDEAFQQTEWLDRQTAVTRTMLTP